MHGLADGSASLRDDGIHHDVASQGNPHDARTMHVVREIEGIHPRTSAAACESAYLHALRESVVQTHQQMLATHAERVCQQEKLRGVVR